MNIYEEPLWRIAHSAKNRARGKLFGAGPSWMHSEFRIFARLVITFASRESRGKLFKGNLTLTSRWIGWLTLSGLPLLAFPPPPPKHFIHGIPGAFPSVCLLFAIPYSLPSSLSWLLLPFRPPVSLSLSLSLSLSPQLRIPRTSHSFPPRSSESGASRDLRRNLLRFEKLTTDGSHVINLVTLSPGRARKIENCVVVEAVEEKLENLKRWLDGRFWRLLNTWAFDACVNVRVDVSSSPGMGS